jgi:hypothetical protein
MPTTSEVKDLGYANGWESVPTELVGCSHMRIRSKVSRNVDQIECKECKFVYKIDMSD